jgi:hypothetical protein
MGQTEDFLNEDWNADDDKHKKKLDRAFVACTEDYEEEYYVLKFKKHYPSTPSASVRTAFKACCAAIKAPHPRKEFEKCMLDRLGIIIGNR